MIPYTGNDNSKQTIQTKSIRSGYKNFVLCSTDGYPYFTNPCCGAKYGGRKIWNNLCAWSVMDCITEIDNMIYRGFFDNLFSSLPLILVLKDQDISATGTVRTDHLDKNMKLNKKSIKAEYRGAIKCHYEINGIGVIC